MRIKFIRKKLVWVAAVIAIFAASVVLVPMLFSRPITSFIESAMNEQISATVHFKRAEVNLWRNFPNFTVSLTDFSIAGVGEFKGDTLVASSDVHLTLKSIPFLFSDELILTEVEFQQPDIHVIVHPNQHTNYDIVREDPDTTSKLQIDIASFHIEQGRFRYEDQVMDLKLSGEELDISGDGDIIDEKMDLDVEAELAHVQFIYKNVSYVQDQQVRMSLTSHYHLKTGMVELEESNIFLNELGLELKGKFSIQNAPVFDLSFQSANSRFKDLLSLSKNLFDEHYQHLDVNGSFSATGMIKGKYDGKIIPSFLLDLRIKDGYVQFDGLPSAISKINLELIAENKDSVIDAVSVRVPEFSVLFGDNPLKGSIAVYGLKKSRVTSAIQAKFDLQDIARILPMPGVKLSGNLDFALSTNGSVQGFENDLQLSRRDFWKGKKLPAFDLSLRIKDGALQYDSLPESISSINFAVKAHNRDGNPESTNIDIEKIQMTLGDNPVTGYWRMQGLSDPLVDADIKVNMDLSEVRRFVPVDAEMRGAFAMDLKMSGHWNDSLKSFPKMDARIHLDNAFINSPELPYAMEQAHLVVEAMNNSGLLADTKVRIDTMMYTIDGERFTLNGEVNNLEELNYSFAARGIVHLAKLRPYLPLDDIDLHGELDVDVRTSGNLSDLRNKAYHRLATSGHVRMSKVTVASSELVRQLEIDRGHIYFTNEKILLDTLHGRIGASQFNVSGHLYNYFSWALHNHESIKGDLLFKSDSINLNEWLSDKRDIRKDTAHHDLKMIRIPTEIDFTMDCDIGHLVYKNIDVTHLRSEVIISNGKIELKDAAYDVLDAEVELSGTLDPTNVRHPSFDLRLKIKELDINKAHAAFLTVQSLAPAAEHTYGIISVDYRLSGKLHENLFPDFNSLVGGGTVDISNARINGMKVFHHISGVTKKEALMNPELNDVVVETTVDKGIIQVKPFTMKVAGFDTDIEGKHDWNGGLNYVLKIALPPFDLVKIPLHVDGTYDNPKIKLGRGHEDRLQQIIQNDQD